MASNREVLAKSIADRFIAAISGTDSDEIIQYNPNDRIYVGKLSPQSSTENISSNVLIKQISVDFRIPKNSMHSANITIHPQGNFFYRVIPTLEQQRKAYTESFVATFTLQEHRISSFSDIALLHEEGKLSPEMVSHKVQVLPIYRKIAIERNGVGFPISIADYYDAQNEYGCVGNESGFKKQVAEQVELLCEEVKSTQDAMPCQFRDKVLIADLLTNQSWEHYKAKQIAREEFDMFPRFNYDIAVEMKGDGQAIDITVAFSNETQFGDESAGFGQVAAKTDYYRINTLFNAGLGIIYSNTELEPIEMDYFADDYKYDKRVYALGNNVSVTPTNVIHQKPQKPLMARRA